jgi:hypothetical protein
MKTLSRIVCLLAIFLAPVARIGADDDKQTAPLFDQVREAIPKLKAEMSEKEVIRLLHVDKLHRDDLRLPSSLSTRVYYTGFGKKSQSLEIAFTGTDAVIGAILRDGNKIVAEFDANKK